MHSTDKRPQPAPKFVNKTAALRRYDISPATLYRWMADPEVRFPRPVRMTSQKLLWLSDDLDEFDRRLISERDKSARRSSRKRDEVAA